MSKIRTLRKLQDISQNELSRRCLMHPSTMSMIEIGRLKPTSNQAAKIAHALGVTVAELGLDEFDAKVDAQ